MVVSVQYLPAANTQQSAVDGLQRKDKVKKKIPHCPNRSKIKYQNRRKRQNRYL